MKLVFVSLTALMLMVVPGSTQNLSGALSGVIESGTYFVVGDISVENGDSLFIEPGVVFLFDGDYDFIIDGYICAVGTEEDSIKFMLNTAVAGWGGIDFNTSSDDSSKLEYCLIIGSISNGIHFSGSNANIGHCAISDNSALTGGGGIYCCYSSPTIYYCNINENFPNSGNGGGIHCEHSNPYIYNCEINGNRSNNNGGGIYCRLNSSPAIENCLISGNSSAYWHGGGIYCDDSNPDILYCTINGNSADDDGGGICCNESNPHIKNCIITGNSASNGGGFYCEDSSPDIISCTISGNSANFDAGGLYCNNSSPAIVNTIMESNIGNGCIYFYNSPGASVTYSDFFNNEGVNFSGSPPPSIGIISAVNANGDSCDLYHNIFDDPLFYAVSGDSAFYLMENSPCINAGDPESQIDPDGTIADMGAIYYHHPGGNVIQVPGDITTIQAAIDAAVNDDTVLIADGIYTSAGNKELDYGGKAIVVISENGVDNCIIDCEDNGRGFYFHSGEDSASFLIGIKIINGLVAEGGGGIYCAYSSPTIEECDISGNSAYYGGGIWCYDACPAMQNCSISGNSANYDGGGIYCWADSHPTITNCTIVGNSGGEGGGICCEYLSSPTIATCTICGNYAYESGGGIYCEYISSPTIEDCAITDNAGVWYGGGIASSFDSNPTISKCVIGGNSAYFGGGISCLTSSLNIANCTISGNASVDDGGGIYCYSSGSIVVNTIVEGNTGNGGIYFYNSTNVSVSYSDFFDNEGDNFSGIPPSNLGLISSVNANGDSCDMNCNIFEDPLFYAVSGDSAFYLTENSPCIDAGDPASPLDPDGTVVDIGSFYYRHGIRDLVISISGEDILLDWSDFPAAAVYQIYRSPDPHFDAISIYHIADVFNSHYEDIGILIQGPLYYLVTWE